MLVKARQDDIDIKRVERHFKELARYDISEKRITTYIEDFLDLLKKEGLHG